MPYVVKVKNEYKIVPSANAYVYTGSLEECEDFINCSPATKEEALKRQQKFLEEAREHSKRKKNKAHP